VHRHDAIDLRAKTGESTRDERPLFRVVTKTGRPTGDVLSDKRCPAGQAGGGCGRLDPARFSGHSLRAGLVTAPASPARGWPN
jgi:hypothetical protein